MSSFKSRKKNHALQRDEKLDILFEALVMDLVDVDPVKFDRLRVWWDTGVKPPRVEVDVLDEVEAGLASDGLTGEERGLLDRIRELWPF